MSLLATREDFEPANPTEGAAALYYDKQTLGGYGETMGECIQMRIDALKGRFAPNNQKTAIWGCGWGWLVNLAVTAGYDAYGFDASSYAINKGKSLYPSIANRLFLRNALTAADVTASKSDAGIHGQTRFTLLVTEDLLDVMSDAEINTTLPLLRGISQANLLHIVTPSGVGTNPDPRINWKTAAQWHALLSPPDVVTDPLGNVI